MLQAQSLPDTGWPTYCLVPLSLLHPTPPIRTAAITNTSAVSPTPTSPPSPHFSLPFLFERIRGESIICRPLHVLPVGFASRPQRLSSISQRTGMGWQRGQELGGRGGGGYHVARPGIQSDTGLSSGSRSLSHKLTAKSPRLFWDPLPSCLSCCIIPGSDCSSSWWPVGAALLWLCRVSGKFFLYVYVFMHGEYILYICLCIYICVHVCVCRMYSYPAQT